MGALPEFAPEGSHGRPLRLGPVGDKSLFGDGIVRKLFCSRLAIQLHGRDRNVNGPMERLKGLALAFEMSITL